MKPAFTHGRVIRALTISHRAHSLFFVLTQSFSVPVSSVAALMSPDHEWSSWHCEFRMHMYICMISLVSGELNWYKRKEYETSDEIKRGYKYPIPLAWCFLPSFLFLLPFLSKWLNHQITCTLGGPMAYQLPNFVRWLHKKMWWWWGRGLNVEFDSLWWGLLCLTQVRDFDVTKGTTSTEWKRCNYTKKLFGVLLSSFSMDPLWYLTNWLDYCT